MVLYQRLERGNTMTDLNRLEADAADLRKMGYAQELLREMGGFSSFAISFSVVSIVTGAIQLYGYGLAHGGPLQITGGWLLVSLFTLFVALAMAELASAFPTAGALYHWSSFLGGRTMGWFTACFNTRRNVRRFWRASTSVWPSSWWDFSLALVTDFLRCFFSRLLLFSHAILNHVGIRLSHGSMIFRPGTTSRSSSRS